MGKITGFMEYDRKANSKVPALERIKNYDEFYVYNDEEERRNQAARCMNCGVPFCGSAIELKGMTTGCPLHNLIPEWNDEIYGGHYAHGLSRLLKTNPFPEFTGRVCPALCEKACINSIDSDAVTVHDNELFLIEYGFANGKMKPRIPAIRSGKKIAVIGSGPSGLAAAQRLNRRGHSITVFERDDRFGGLLMYGIPNMKLDKKIVERRINLMREEGIEFVPNKNLGVNITLDELKSEFDAVILACGAKKARDLAVSNRDAAGVYFAVDFLSSTTRSIIDGNLAKEKYISAKDKNVVILGGGDTGNDCVGTSVRHGAKSVTQLEMMKKPPVERADSNPYPEYPRVLSVDYGQDEAINVYGSDPRVFETTIKEIIAENGQITGVKTVQVEFAAGKITEIADTEKVLPADLLLIAAGFTGCEEYSKCGLNIPTRNDESYVSDDSKVFACGDMKRGQSLVVTAIADGIKCAREVDTFLMEYTNI